MRRPTIDYPDDIGIIRRAVPALRTVTAQDIQALYREFSETVSACWLTPNDYWVGRFQRWLAEEQDDGLDPHPMT